MSEPAPRKAAELGYLVGPIAEPLEQQPLPACYRCGKQPCECPDQITLLCGDCLPWLANLHADVLLTDPPYSSGGHQESGKTAGSVGVRGGATIALDNLSTLGYRALLRETIRRCQADECYVFTDWKMWPWIVEAAELGGVKTRAMIVWDKGHPGLGVPWRSQHELIYYGRRTPAVVNQGKSGNVLQCGRTRNLHHDTEKPVELCKRLLLNSIEGLVLDPFCGSGTTLLAAKQLGRPAVGIELSPHYCERAADRLAQGQLF